MSSCFATLAFYAIWCYHNWLCYTDTWVYISVYFILLCCLTHWLLGNCARNFKNIIFKLIMQDSNLGTHCEIILRWMPQNFINEESTSVQVVAHCLITPSHYLSQCWPRSMFLYGINRPQWVKWFSQAQAEHQVNHFITMTLIQYKDVILPI